MAISFSFPFSWAAQPEARGRRSLLGAVFSTASFLHLSDLQNLTDFLSSPSYPIYPTPLLGQDMTQGQFFKRSLTGFNSEFSFS